MGEERFKALAAAFGGDLSRWPREVRRDARRHLARTPGARAVLAEEAALDALLGPPDCSAAKKRRQDLGRTVLQRLARGVRS